MSPSRVWTSLLALAAALCLSHLAITAADAPAVLVLGGANFSETIARHDFIVVKFYAPWCGHCQELAPEYEEAASILNKHIPSIVLAEVDVDAKENEELATTYKIEAYPTIKIIRNAGAQVEDYTGPSEADGIIKYLQKQRGPPSTEIESAEDIASLLEDQFVTIVGAFSEFSGLEYDTFIKAAEGLRSDYAFGHTLNAEFLPYGNSMMQKPFIRLFKSFDELFTDFQDFDVDAIQRFVEYASVPTVTIYDNDEKNYPFIEKYFSSADTKVMLYLNFKNADFDVLKTMYYEIAKQFKGENLRFLIADLSVTKGVLKFYGINRDDAPLIFILKTNGEKYLLPHVRVDQIATWLVEFKAGSLQPFKKSEPIPQVNNDPVIVVVADSVDDIVIHSGKNVLFEFYAPWCGHCKRLAPILVEVALFFKNDLDFIVAKMDATKNDIPKIFAVQGYPTLYLFSANGNLVKFGGKRTLEEIINFVEKNRNSSSGSDTFVEDQAQSYTQSDPIKDEL